MSRAERERAARLAVDYDWPALVADGWKVTRPEHNPICYVAVRLGVELTVNLSCGELWFKFDYDHSRDALLLEEFVQFDGPALEEIALRFTKAVLREALPYSFAEPGPLAESAP